MRPEKTPRERAEDLIRLLVLDWRPTPRQVLWAIRIAIMLGILIAIGYFYGIRLWDWIKLLIVPAVIAAGAAWFNQQQRVRELRIADSRAQDDALQAYLDQIGQLLLDNDRPLRLSEQDSEVQTLARARTQTVLGRLDPMRKGSVVRFLYESGLIASEKPVLDLSGADLSDAYLRGANLGRADLSRANLKGADLSREANLIEANLSYADLAGADLSMMTYLTDATLIGANLSRANLSHARLIRATITEPPMGR